MTNKINGLTDTSSNLPMDMTRGQVLKAANGLEIITPHRGDLLASNRGNVFKPANTRGLFKGVGFTTNKAGERVIAGSTADDTTMSDGDVLVANAASVDRRRKENKVPAQVG